jgi:hypothetical protein
MGVALADVKAALRVIHAEDDAELTRLLDSATREYLAFIDSGALPEEVEAAGGTPGEVFIPEDAFNGIVLMVRADYESDPLDRKKLREAAESLWFPYRKGLGV